VKPLTAAALTSTILASIFGRVVVWPFSIVAFAAMGLCIYAIAYVHGSERASKSHPATSWSEPVRWLPLATARPAVARRKAWPWIRS
jgi:hypothetical protein